MVFVTAAIIERDSKILIAQRKKGDRLEYKWEFPGGKIEKGESPEACLKRELSEEFGIESAVCKFFCSSKYVYPHVSVDLLAYNVTYESGDFKLNSHEAINWISIDELSNYDFAEADKPIVMKLKEENHDI